jgi:hypothetical protein
MNDEMQKPEGDEVDGGQALPATDAPVPEGEEKPQGGGEGSGM